MKTLKIICLCIMICVALCNTETTLKIKRVRKVAPAEWVIVIISYLCVVLMLIMNIL